MPYRPLADRRALITGASSGIGRAIALELARHGVDLVLVARREERLSEVAHEISALSRKAVLVVGDITDAATRRRAVEAARDQLGGLDILINNAGVAAHGRFAESSPERIRPLFEVNFFAPVELIREATPLLKNGVQSIVVNIGSILGERASPHKSEYSASKFALHGFSEALRPELARLGIDLLVVAAGPTETEHFDVLLEGDANLPWGNPPRQPADAAARTIIRAIERNKRMIVTGWRARLLLLANRLFPGVVDRVMRRWG
jgi:short-subunit dehydrogenase